MVGCFVRRACVLRRGDDAGFSLTQAGQHLLRIRANRGDNSHAGDDDATHGLPSRLLRLAQLVRRVEADLQVLGAIDGFAIGQNDAVADAL